MDSSENFYTQRDKALGALPYPLRVIVGYMIYRSHTQTLYGQGVGRFNDDEARRFREEIWTTLEDLLNERRKVAIQRNEGKDQGSCFWCLGGERPTDCDTTVFGFIVSTLVAKRQV
jgi:hypothetical protein